MVYAGLRLAFLSCQAVQPVVVEEEGPFEYEQEVLP
jgi:hypothetical protein